MKVKDFKGFMSSKAINEQENFDGTDAGMQYGANPEDDAAEGEFEEEGLEDEEGMEGEEEEVTLEDLKAIVDDLTERIEALEPDEEEGEEGDMEDEEGAEEEGAEEEGA
jgi:hypothetical protein